MIGIAGDCLLMVACAMALLQSLSFWRSARDVRWLRILQWASTAQFASVAVAFLLLIIAFVTSDFSVENVYQTSHTAKPMIYKISAAWGSHEGSMLLWLCVLSGFSFAAGRGQSAAPLRQRMLAVQGMLAFGLALYTVATSSPFTSLSPAPDEGLGMNPLLQDIGIALHPPMLYLGYVGCGVVFAFAVAGLWAHRIDSAWAAAVHPWITRSWAFLTFGIGLGSWWAYRELGWGGWWFWDPVENVSLMPWLALSALMHTNRSLMVDGSYPRWTAFLAISAFALSLIGTFIVRSGLLVSVHSFASSPERGLFVLGYIVLAVGFALFTFGRYRTADNAASFRLASRSGMILVSSLFLLAATATILLAIFYPVFLQLLNRPSITVGAPYFNQTILPLAAPLILMAGIVPFLGWKTGRFSHALTAMAPVLIVTLAAAIFLFIMLDHRPFLTACGIALSLWLAGGTLRWAWLQRQSSGRIPRRSWGMLVGHTGAALFVFALTISSLQKTTIEATLAMGDSQQSGEYRIEFLRGETGTVANYQRQLFTVRLYRQDDEIATLSPEIRFYPERMMTTVEASVASGLQGDIYITAGSLADPSHFGFTLHLNPAMNGLWLAFLLMGAGGFLASYRTKTHDVVKTTQEHSETGAHHG